MRGYLVDPRAREVSEIEHDESTGGLCEIMNCAALTVVGSITGGGIRDALYTDGDGPAATQGQFMIKGQVTPITGRAIYSGHTRDGDMCDPKLPLDRLRSLVIFV